MPYVRDSFWRGREVTRPPQMQDAALTWCQQVAGVRSHRGLDGAGPFKEFQAVEAQALIPLPRHDFQHTSWSVGKVGVDCHVTVGIRPAGHPLLCGPCAVTRWLRTLDLEITAVSTRVLARRLRKRPRSPTGHRTSADPPDPSRRPPSTCRC